MVENNVGIGENAGHQHFLLSQQCFQNPFFPESLKVGIAWWVVIAHIPFICYNIFAKHF